MSPAIEALRGEGLALLGAMEQVRPETLQWSQWLQKYQFTQAPDDPYIWFSCILALEAVNHGNYGVGAVMVRGEQIVARGNNHLLTPYMRTDRHAEMEALTQFEEAFRDVTSILGFRLYTSLECCPMCTVRLINAGIRTVRYAAADPMCGIIQSWEGLPPFWRRMAASRTPPQRFEQAHCSAELLECAGAIFVINEEENSQKVRRR